MLGRLNNEYLLNQYVRVEDNNLAFLKANQNLIARGSQNALPQHNAATSTDAMRPVHTTHLNDQFQGSPLYMKSQVSKGLEICRKLGKPYFFITFTCNPFWNEIQCMLLPGQSWCDQPMLVTRVFNLKLQALLKRLCKGHIFNLDFKRYLPKSQEIVSDVEYFEMKNGRKTGWLIRVIEFQHRGLVDCTLTCCKYIALNLYSKRPTNHHKLVHSTCGL